MRSPLLLRRPDADVFILIEDHVVRILDRYRQRSPDLPESGGILLGYRRERHLHVTDAIVPQKQDNQKSGLPPEQWALPAYACP